MTLKNNLIPPLPFVELLTFSTGSMVVFLCVLFSVYITNTLMGKDYE